MYLGASGEAKQARKAARALTIVILLAAVSGLARKYVPGQPSWVEVLPSLAVIAVYVSLRNPARGAPSWFLGPLKLLVCFQLVYALLGVNENWKVSGIAVFTRLAPMLLVVVAYRAGKDPDCVRTNAKVLAYIVLAQVPGAVLTLLGQASRLPSAFLPIYSVIESGKASREGVVAYSGLFSTPWLAGTGVLACVYACLQGVQVEVSRLKRQLYWWGAASGLILLYVSTRRGALVMGAMAFVVPLLAGRRRAVRHLAMLAVLAILAFYLLSSEAAPTGPGSYQSRMQFIEDVSATERITDVFLPIVEHWAEDRPWGSYLGCYGPEAVPLLGSWRDRGLYPIEVGAALLIAETGIFGAALYVALLASIWIGGWLARDKKQNRSLAMLLLGYQLCYFTLFFSKESLALSNVSLGQFMFWITLGLYGSVATGPPLPVNNAVHKQKSDLKTFKRVNIHGVLQSPQSCCRDNCGRDNNPPKATLSPFYKNYSQS